MVEFGSEDHLNVAEPLFLPPPPLNNNNNDNNNIIILIVNLTANGLLPSGSGCNACI